MAKIVQVAVGKIGAASEDFTMTAKKRFFLLFFVSFFRARIRTKSLVVVFFLPVDIV